MVFKHNKLYIIYALYTHTDTYTHMHITYTASQAEGNIEYLIFATKILVANIYFIELSHDNYYCKTFRTQNFIGR